MAELLLELLTEEIPARMQGIAAEELRRLAEVAFDEAHLRASRLVSFVTPRRLTRLAEGLPATQPGSKEERRGPRVGAPEAAVQGFLKSAGLSSLDARNARPTRASSISRCSSAQGRSPPRFCPAFCARSSSPSTGPNRCAFRRRPSAGCGRSRACLRSSTTAF